jgi:hypothetical protein
VYGAAHGSYFLEQLTMGIIDDRPQTGVAIGLLAGGTFFLSRGTLYFKDESNAVIDLQHGRRISYEPRTCVQPVTVDIFIPSKKD